MMLTRLRRELFADPNGSAALIRRLFLEHGPVHWRSYSMSLGFMAIGAACTAGSAYLLGYGIHQAYVYCRFQRVAVVSLAAIVAFTLKGAATEGQAVPLARIGNHIAAGNQRRRFDKLL